MERIQDSPRVASECLSVSLDFLQKVMSLWVFIEWKRPRVSLMECRLLGCMELMAIMGAFKAMLCTQCHVTPHGMFHGQI